MNTNTEIASDVELGSTIAAAAKGNEMTGIQIELVRSSFDQVAQMADAAGALFYRRLFELDPSLRSLFRSDLQAQGRKLIQMLGMAVAWLDRPDMLLNTIEALARRHELYGVRLVIIRQSASRSYGLSTKVSARLLHLKSKPPGLQFSNLFLLSCNDSR